MAKEARKLQRQADGSEGKAKKKADRSLPQMSPDAIPDPLSAANLKTLGWRIGIPIAGAWLLGALIAGISQSATVRWIALGVPALLSLVVAGVLIWTFRQAKKVRGVAGILSGIETAEDRKAALERLDANYKGSDPTAIFAKAQLLMQEDPKKALSVLEQIDLNKAMATVADEARAQRAMIHLMLGEVTPARDLSDAIDLTRHQDAKTRAMMGAVVAEAWARSGQAKRAQTTLEVFNPEDEALAQVKPQIYRAQAFVGAYVSDPKLMKRALRKLADQDVRLLAGFLTKKIHPLLQKEAKRMLEQSGQVPRKMIIQRH